ncbi:hypothetical protein BJV78DRAFT_1153551 [Lactifluus subvellereus]|nr:hypothetical protein BJV78DRAFT_1153551 [Lactifluus subvellereus]
MTERPTPLTLRELLAACHLRLLEWAKGKSAVEIFCSLVSKRGWGGGNKTVKLPVAESRRSRVEKSTSTQCVLHVFQRISGRWAPGNKKYAAVSSAALHFGAISLTVWEVKWLRQLAGTMGSIKKREDFVTENHTTRIRAKVAEEIMLSDLSISVRYAASLPLPGRATTRESGPNLRDDTDSRDPTALSNESKLRTTKCTEFRSRYLAVS